jgi:4-diphosphocytidyl-2-C-methyl-D-erythritol kinase
MVVFPNAKINIGLHITGRRDDGYHDIESCFYPIPWTDILEVVQNVSFLFKATGISIPGTTENNLCIQAYKLLEEDSQLSPVSIHLHKIIPIGAGLGGGSSDGAFALKAINDIFSLNLEENQLKNYALRLGSDCPFFITNKPVFVGGRGEVFEKIELDLKGKFILMVNPSIHISTAEAYCNVKNYSKAGVLKNNLENIPIENWREKIKNDFEEPLFKKYPAIALIKKNLYQKGAIYASMTGSGASVYGIFDKKIESKSWLPRDHMVWQGEL